MALLYEDYIGDNVDAFIARLTQVAANIGVDPNWLMLIMKNESGIDPQAVNPSSNATGLIQFMPSTAIGLGTTVAKLKEMDNVQQLDYVEKFFQGAKSLPFNKSAFDTYLVVFFPKAVGQSDDYVIASKGQPVYDKNPVLDYNQDGIITKGDFRNYLINKYPDQVAWFRNATPSGPAPEQNKPTPDKQATGGNKPTGTSALPTFGSFFPTIPQLQGFTWVEVGVGAIVALTVLKLLTNRVNT